MFGLLQIGLSIYNKNEINITKAVCERLLACDVKPADITVLSLYEAHRSYMQTQLVEMVHNKTVFSVLKILCN